MLSLAPAELAPMIAGEFFSQTLEASGGTAPYSYSVTSGALPAGLLLDPQSGVLSGTPITAGPFSFAITATDALGCLGSANYSASVLVATPALSIPTLSAWSLILLLGSMLGVGMLATRR